MLVKDGDLSTLNTDTTQADTLKAKRVNLYTHYPPRCSGDRGGNRKMKPQAKCGQRALPTNTQDRRGWGHTLLFLDSLIAPEARTQRFSFVTGNGRSHNRARW